MPTEAEIIAQAITSVQCPKEADVVVWYPFVTMSAFWQSQELAAAEELPENSSKGLVPTKSGG